MEKNKHKLLSRVGDKKLFDTDTYILIFELLVLLIVCVLHALAAGHYIDFWPINGTFQNFNPVRRLLDGQIPCKDFQDYLGMGHLYLGTLATILFGGDYQASLMAFSFLTFFTLAFILFIIGNAILSKKTTALAMTNIVLIMLIVQPLFFSNALIGMEEIGKALESALGPGNSARFVRGMILPISCAAIFILHKLYKKIESERHNFLRYKIWIELSGIGVIAGFSFIYSNDYGISCWLCLWVMTFFVMLARTRKIVNSIIGAFTELIVSVVSIFIFVEIFTLGHFGRWLNLTFGTGGYQGWYYNGGKSFYLYDVDFSYLMMIQGILCIVYLIFLFKTYAGQETIWRYGIPAFCNMVCFCAVNEYHLLSGNNSREVALAVLFATILFEICNYLGTIFKKENRNSVIVIISFIVSIAWIISDFKEEVLFWKISDKQGEYFEVLGGNMRSRGNDLKNTAEFLNGEDFFATYASAQEVVCNIFQPSGTDYIIHVLGDEQRIDYLESFNNGGFKYAATIREELTRWEYWVQRANWFFYRKLYGEWHPVYFNSYEMYWEKNKENENNVLTDAYSIKVEDINEATKKIIVQTDSWVNGVADVYIDYEVRKNDRPSSNFLFQSMLKIENSGIPFFEDSYYESNYLRNVSAEFVPVRVVNGYGEITLTASPAESTYLILNEASCSEIYQVIFNYIECLSIENGDTEIIIKALNEIKNQKALENVAGVVIGGTEYPVSEIRSDEQSLYIIIPKNEIGDNLDKESIKYNNVLRLVKEFDE